MTHKPIVALLACFAMIAWTDAQAQSEVAVEETATAVDPVVAALTTRGEMQTKAVQQALAAAGFNPGPADGDWGAASWNALKKWRAAHADLQLAKEAFRSLSHLTDVAPPASGVRPTFVNGQHMVVPAQGETRPFQWDTKTNAWKAPKDYGFSSSSQGWVSLQIGAEQDLILVFDGASFSPDGQILLGKPLGSRRLEATLSSKDGKLLGRAACRIGEAALISDVVVPCGFAVSLPY